jgi:hypothetical protein
MQKEESIFYSLLPGIVCSKEKLKLTSPLKHLCLKLVILSFETIKRHVFINDKS